MADLSTDIAVIGAGPAGLAAALSAKKNCTEKIIIIDRNNWLGGILPQCIHDGFGVEETGKSMTGPEYADKYIEQVRKNKIPIFTETMVLHISKNKVITILSKKGLQKIKAKSIIFATGCREKTRWNALIPGSRPSGIFTAGVAQGFINLYNIMPGKKIVVLGSGDVGLIMARRLTFEGAKVLGVVELFPYASGLPRNIVQCLDDYNIPLYLNHTVTYIKGDGRINEVTISQVDENLNPILGTEKKIKCDTLLLSLGLIPENELAKEIGIKIDEITGGPVVDQDFQTSISGIFSCGNCLHVYDTVDMLSADSKLAGFNSSEFTKNINKKERKDIQVLSGNGIRYIIPHKINKPKKITFSLRVAKPQENVKLIVKNKDSTLFEKKLRYVNPANMIKFDLNISEKIISSNDFVEVSIK